MGFDVLDHPLVLAHPRRLTDVTAWHGLIPVAFALTALHRPRVFVELGTHKGDSYCAFCQAVETLELPSRCYAVDSWEGDPQAGFYPAEVYEELRAYHDPRYGRFSSLLRMTFDEALPCFADGEIDLLHIDGLHTYEAVRHDFEAWLPKMSRRGVVLFHDVTVREGDFGVWRLWEEVKQRYPTRLFGFSHGLGIAAVGEAALEAGLKDWFDAGESEWRRIEALFAALGERWTNWDRIRTLERSLDGVRKELALVRRKIAEEHEQWDRWSQEKSNEIARLQAVLQERETELVEARAALQEQRTESDRLRAGFRQAELAERDLEAILDSWPWRLVARHWVPVVKPPSLEEPAPMSLVEIPQSIPLDIPPRTLWPGSGKTLGGMRRFLVPRAVFGDRVEWFDRQAGVLKVQGEDARLLVELDGFLAAAKVVLGVAGEEEVQVGVEFGSLGSQGWHPLVRREVRISPRKPAVLYFRLPEAVATMALAFPTAGQVRFSQIAVSAVTPVEQRFGPVLRPLQRGIALFRHRPWQRLRRGVKRYGWWGAVQVVRQRLGGADSALPLPQDSGPGLPVQVQAEPGQATDGGDPYAYLSGEAADLRGRRMAVLASSEGNFFMREIGRAIGQAAEMLGAEVLLGDERDRLDPKRWDWIVVVAPHEFFTLGRGRGRLAVYADHKGLLLVNTEQPQTQWFQTAAAFFSAARAVLDIHYQTAVRLRRMGIRAYFLPIGHNGVSENAERALPEHPALRHLSEEVRRCAPERYSDRPFDLLFVGTASPRRKAFFARHARFFAGLNTFLYLPEGNVPFGADGPRTLDFAALSGLVRRSKIVLNIHRDDHPYLEWQRVVNLGILQQTLVVSEHCDDCPALRANEDYLDLPLDLIPTVCAHYLGHPEASERFARRAFARVSRELAMERILARLIAAVEMP